VFAARVKADRAAIDPADLLGHAAQRLPDYMLPAIVQVVDALPLTANGKVDRTALLGWLTHPEQALPRPATESPRTPTERRLAAMWAEALRVDRVGVNDNFFDLGGDSLVAAQFAGRLLEEYTEAGPLFFDDVLRQLLEYPTVADLAAYLAARTPDESVPTAPEEVLVPLRPGRTGPAHVFVHNGGGDLAPFASLCAALPGDDPVVGIAAADPAGFADVDPESLVDHLAARYARRLREAGYGPVRLVGHGLGGLLAVEVARVLTEGGDDPVGVTVVAGYRPAPDAPADPLIAAEVGPVPTATARSTFAALVRAVARHPVGPYAGDLTIIRPDTGPGATDDAVAFFAELCLGDVRVLAVPGDHLGCLTGLSATRIAAAVATAPA
jgi:pyochelin synthetase